MTIGIVVYRCPDGIHYSRYSDLRDCPARSPIGVDLGATGDRTRFLGSRGRAVTSYADLGIVTETPEPETLDRKKLLGIGIAAFAVVLLFFILARRRKR